MICKVACCDDDRKQLEHIKKYFETLSIQTDLEFEVNYYTSQRSINYIFDQLSKIHASKFSGSSISVYD